MTAGEIPRNFAVFFKRPISGVHRLANRVEGDVREIAQCHFNFQRAELGLPFRAVSQSQSSAQHCPRGDTKLI